MMSGKEKLYFILNRIDDIKVIAPSGKPLIIDPTNDLNRRYREIELLQLFTKLEKNERVLKILKVPRRITIDEYDKLYKDFRQKIASIEYKLTNLQQAEDNYYLTAKYLLELANRAYDLFMSSEIEEKRQLLKLTLQNLRLKGKTVQYEAIKPFDKILFYASRQQWLPRWDSIRTEKWLREIWFRNNYQFQFIAGA